MAGAPETILRMDDNNKAILIEILHRHEERVKAIANMKHATEAERNILLNEAAVAQMAYLQLEGMNLTSPDRSSQWFQEEVPYRVKGGETIV